jgi:hypothetical protein
MNFYPLAPNNQKNTRLRYDYLTYWGHEEWHAVVLLSYAAHPARCLYSTRPRIQRAVLRTPKRSTKFKVCL